MAEKPLEGMQVAILVDNDFEQVELTEPRKALEEAGATCRIVSPKQGSITGMKHDEKKDSFQVDVSLEKATTGEFDAVLVPGGALNADSLRVDPKAQQFILDMERSGKPMAVICHAPWLLVSAGLVRGRRLTCYHTIRDDIRNAGGLYEDSEVVRDGNLVTSRQPSDIPAFNREMIALFSEFKQAARTPRAA